MVRGAGMASMLCGVCKSYLSSTEPLSQGMAQGCLLGTQICLLRVRPRALWCSTPVLAGAGSCAEGQQCRTKADRSQLAAQHLPKQSLTSLL